MNLPKLENTGIGSISSLCDGKLARIGGNKRATLAMSDSGLWGFKASARLGRRVEGGPPSSPSECGDLGNKHKI